MNEIPCVVMANGWRMIITADVESSRLRISVGHPEIEAYSTILYPLSQLGNGLDIDIGRMIDTALGLHREELPKPTKR